MNASPAPLALRLDFPLRTIQSARLAQAIMESGHEIHLPEDPHGQFAHLRKYFPLSYETGDGAVASLTGVEIDHAGPRTKIGALERPLIFPHAIFDHCRAGWPDTRDVKFFFAGLVTAERARALQTWAQANGLALPVPRQEGRFGRWFRKKVLRAATLPTTKAESDGVVFWSSERGREYPVKAWDEDYYRAMTRAQLVLCPSGDFVWTYRFFESALCGAVPVVEETCPAYEGFQFFTLRQPVAELRRTEEMAAHNFALCRERLTVPRAALDAELARLAARTH
jgi:hypothetical protein